MFSSDEKAFSVQQFEIGIEHETNGTKALRVQSQTQSAKTEHTSKTSFLWDFRMVRTCFIIIHYNQKPGIVILAKLQNDAALTRYISYDAYSISVLQKKAPTFYNIY